jgi:hypothetical protein
VVQVVDGDTIEVEMDGRRHTVRYIGIDTPEVADPRRPVMCYGEEASRRNRQLVEGRTVLLEKNVSETDRYGRLLRYVWADGVFVNAALVRRDMQGFTPSLPMSGTPSSSGAWKERRGSRAAASGAPAPLPLRQQDRGRDGSHGQEVFLRRPWL